MASDEAFLRAIYEHPEDDVPRLVYADWLEEQGQTARSELIRLQCEAGRLSNNEGRLSWLVERIRELIERATGMLAPHLPRPDGIAWAYQRGLPDYVIAANPDVFLRHADALLMAAPVLTVAFEGANHNQVRTLAAHPHLARLWGVSFATNRGQQPLGTEWIQILADSPHVAGLSSLELYGNNLGVAGAMVLADAPRFGGLRRLGLGNCQVGDAGVIALAGSRHLRRLTGLDLWGCHCSDAAATALAGSPMLAGLSNLRLTVNRITDRGVRALAGSPHASQLTVLI